MAFQYLAKIGFILGITLFALNSPSMAAKEGAYCGPTPGSGCEKDDSSCKRCYCTPRGSGLPLARYTSDDCQNCGFTDPFGTYYDCTDS